MFFKIAKSKDKFIIGKWNQIFLTCLILKYLKYGNAEESLNS